MVAITSTLLTIAVNADYTVANAEITDFYYSHQANPIGYPHWFAYVPTLTAGNTDISGYDLARFRIDGMSVTINFVANNRTLSGTAGAINISVPILPKDGSTSIKSYYNGADNYVITDTTNGLAIYKGAAGNWVANETGVYLKLFGTYEAS